MAEKEKPDVEKKIVVMTKEGEKTLIEITITEGDIVKTLILDKLLPIISGEGGRGLVLIFIIPRQPAIRQAIIKGLFSPIPRP